MQLPRKPVSLIYKDGRIQEERVDFPFPPWLNVHDPSSSHESFSLTGDLPACPQVQHCTFELQQIVTSDGAGVYYQYYEV